MKTKKTKKTNELSQEDQRIEEEIEVYQDSLRIFMENSFIARSLGESNIRVDECTLVMDSSDDVPENEPSVMVKGKYPWLKLIMNSEAKDLRFQIDLKELEQTYGNKK